MNKSYPIIVVLTVLFGTPPAFSQTLAFDTTRYSITELQEDFAFWRDKLEKKSPLLYLYNSKAATNHYLDSVYDLIDRPMNSVEFYRLLAPVNAFLKDQHTCIFPGVVLFNSVSTFPNLLPVDIKYIEKRPVIATNYSSCERLEPGTEVIRINGVSCEVIVETLHAVIQRDGNNLALPIETINRNFWFYYHLMYGASDWYDFQFKSTDGTVGSCRVPGLSMEEMEAPLEEESEHRAPGLYLDRIDSLPAGILTINDFSNSTFRKNQGQSYKRLIAAHFKAINETGIEVLLIDVRNNQGGNPNNVKHTLKFLLDQPFELITELRQVRDHNAESFLSRTRKRWYPTLGIGTFKPHKKTYTGKVLVLMNGQSLSASAELVSVLKRYRRAEFMGTMSGGNPVVLSGSLSKGYWELPNTKLRAFVPNKCQILGSMSSNTGLGLMPDYVVEPKMEDVNTDTDPVLDAAIKWIKSNIHESR